MSAEPISRSPATRVQGATELLVAILEQLDMQTLLVSAHRVSRSWHCIIDNTPSLQKKLFLMPDETAPVGTVNSLLLHTFPFCFPREEWDWTEPGRQSCYIVRNDPCDSPMRKWRRISNAEREAIEKNSQALQRHDASWKKMYTHQPPLRGFCRQVIKPMGMDLQFLFGDDIIRMPMLIKYMFSPDDVRDGRGIVETKHIAVGVLLAPTDDEYLRQFPLFNEWEDRELPFEVFIVEELWWNNGEPRCCNFAAVADVLSAAIAE
ncbi:hypothetical protein E8E14_003404 [Neopestalotiopsis sp. 37M]|nr:hypothetical protein E8E14_003404 [Neopestalotiopsis sp. 37M]